MIIEKIPYPFNEEESRLFHKLSSKQSAELTEEEKAINAELLKKMSEYGKEKIEYVSNYNGSKRKILGEVREILKATTKEDFIKHMKSQNITINPTEETKMCFNFLIGILNLQLMAYYYYGYNAKEIFDLAEKRMLDWFLFPNDDNCYDDPPEELPRVKKAPTPKKCTLATYKLVDVLFSGEFPVGVEKYVNMASEKDNRKGRTAYTLMMLNFDELGDGIKISRELSVYDQQVWNACTNLMLNDYKIITPSQIYHWMGYENQMNDRDKNRIMESVNTIIRARVLIDNANERKLYKKYPEISLNTPLLAAKVCTAKSGKNEVTAIEMLEVPDLFGVARERGQITTVPFEVLEVSEIDRTEENLKLLTYLSRRIVHMKHDSDVSRKILLQAICVKCGIDTRLKKFRLPEKLSKIFDHYKKVKWIEGYELTDNEVMIKLPNKG